MSLRKALPLALLLIVLSMLGVAALLLASASLQGFIHYSPPFGQASTPGRPGQRLSDRVVLIVVDGLRYDASLEMPYLNELRHQGAEFITETGQPSLSLPGWTTLGTGAGPEISGVTTNWYQGAVRLDTVLAEAKRAGLKTAIVGDKAWDQLYGASVDVGRYPYYPPTGSPSGDHVFPGPASYWDEARNVGIDEDFAREALAILRTERPGLLVLHFLGPDQFAHGYGAASQKYADDVARVDELVRQIVGGVSLDDTTVIVTSDHGHVDRGGHGGPEPEVVRTPLVLVGVGTTRPRLPGRAPPLVDQRDVAPTVAVLLGTAIPAQSQGRPLFEALAAPSEVRAARAVDVALQRQAFDTTYARQLGVEPPAMDLVETATAGLQTRYYAQAVADADEALVELGRWREAAREERLGRDRLARTPLAAVALILPLAFAALARPRRETLLGLPIGLAYSLAFWALYFARGYTVSLGTFNTEANMAPFFAARSVDAAVLALALAGAIGLAYHRAGAGAAARLSARANFWMVTFLVWQAALFYSLYGVTYSVYLPDMQLAFKFYLDLLQLAGVGLASAPGIGLAAALAALATRALPRPTPTVGVT